MIVLIALAPLVGTVLFAGIADKLRQHRQVRDASDLAARKVVEDSFFTFAETQIGGAR